MTDAAKKKLEKVDEQLEGEFGLAAASAAVTSCPDAGAQLIPSRMYMFSLIRAIKTHYETVHKMELPEDERVYTHPEFQEKVKMELLSRPKPQFFKEHATGEMKRQRQRRTAAKESENNSEDDSDAAELVNSAEEGLDDAEDAVAAGAMSLRETTSSKQAAAMRANKAAPLPMKSAVLPKKRLTGAEAVRAGIASVFQTSKKNLQKKLGRQQQQVLSDLFQLRSKLEWVRLYAMAGGVTNTSIVTTYGQGGVRFGSAQSRIPPPESKVWTAMGRMSGLEPSRCRTLVQNLGTGLNMNRPGNVDKFGLFAEPACKLDARACTFASHFKSVILIPLQEFSGRDLESILTPYSKKIVEAVTDAWVRRGWIMQFKTAKMAPIAHLGDKPQWTVSHRARMTLFGKKDDFVRFASLFRVAQNFTSDGRLQDFRATLTGEQVACLAEALLDPRSGFREELAAPADVKRISDEKLAFEELELGSETVHLNKNKQALIDFFEKGPDEDVAMEGLGASSEVEGRNNGNKKILLEEEDVDMEDEDEEDDDSAEEEEEDDSDSESDSDAEHLERDILEDDDVQWAGGRATAVGKGVTLHLKDTAEHPYPVALQYKNAKFRAGFQTGEPQWLTRLERASYEALVAVANGEKRFANAVVTEGGEEEEEEVVVEGGEADVVLGAAAPASSQEDPSSQGPPVGGAVVAGGRGRKKKPPVFKAHHVLNESFEPFNTPVDFRERVANRGLKAAIAKVVETGVKTHAARVKATRAKLDFLGTAVDNLDNDSDDDLEDEEGNAGDVVETGPACYVPANPEDLAKRLVQLAQHKEELLDLDTDKRICDLEKLRLVVCFSTGTLMRNSDAVIAMPAHSGRKYCRRRQLFDQMAPDEEMDPDHEEDHYSPKQVIASPHQPRKIAYRFPPGLTGRMARVYGPPAVNERQLRTKAEEVLKIANSSEYAERQNITFEVLGFEHIPPAIWTRIDGSFNAQLLNSLSVRIWNLLWKAPGQDAQALARTLPFVDCSEVAMLCQGYLSNFVEERWGCFFAKDLRDLVINFL